MSYRTSPAFAVASRNVVSRCTSIRLADGEFSGGKQERCEAYMTSDGEFHNTCGEPCRCAMGKRGEGYPPNG